VCDILTSKLVLFNSHLTGHSMFKWQLSLGDICILGDKRLRVEEDDFFHSCLD
jgi:hypothetical protein